MAATRLDSSLMPAAMWNTHIACLSSLCDAAARGLDVVQVAGLTGLAFRTALSERVTPAGLYLSWTWEPSFRCWLNALGLDADVTAHHAGLPAFNSWLDRQHGRIRATLDMGFPVLYWDNVGFALILGEDDDGYLVSGVPEFTVHPEWHEQPQTAAFCSRLLKHRTAAGDKPLPYHISRDELVSVIEPGALFIYLQGVSRFDPDAAWREGIQHAFAELSGRIEYPRRRVHRDGMSIPQFGTTALTQWREELKDGRVHGFGMIQAVQSLIEARQLAVKYLLSLVESVEPRYHARLAQSAQFFKRIVEHLRPAAIAFDVPYDSAGQMTRAHWDKCREALYQVQMTEQTAGRLLGSIAQEIQDG